MTAQLQSLINQAKKLSHAEQLQLMSAISDLLQRKYRRNSDFWNPGTASELADEQQVHAAESIADLGADFWPDEESADEFNQFIRQQRQLDRLDDK